MGEELHPQALVLVSWEVGPVAADLDVQSGGTKKLHLGELQEKMNKQFKLDSISLLCLGLTGPEKGQTHKRTLSGASKAQQKCHA